MAGVVLDAEKVLKIVGAKLLGVMQGHTAVSHDQERLLAVRDAAQVALAIRADAAVVVVDLIEYRLIESAYKAP